MCLFNIHPVELLHLLFIHIYTKYGAPWFKRDYRSYEKSTAWRILVCTVMWRSSYPGTLSMVFDLSKQILVSINLHDSKTYPFVAVLAEQSTRTYPVMNELPWNIYLFESAYKRKSVLMFATSKVTYVL